MHINEDIVSLGLTLRGAMDFTEDRGQWGGHSFVHITGVTS